MRRSIQLWQIHFYAGTDDARMLRLSHGAVYSILSMLSITSRGGMLGMLVRQLLTGSVSGHRWAFALLRPTRPATYFSPTFTWEAFRVQWMAEEPGSPP